MKRMAWMFMGAALLLGVTLSSAQSLGDVARANRKAKVQNTSAKHFDNDNLPSESKLSVVGPQPASDTKSDAGNGQPSNATSDNKAASPSASTASKSSEDAMKAKVDAQKQKIDTMSKDLDLKEREYRLRAVEMYSDAGNRLRNAAQWDKDDAQYKKEIADKQAALDAAKQELQNLEEQERTGEAPAEKK